MDLTVKKRVELQPAIISIEIDGAHQIEEPPPQVIATTEATNGKPENGSKQNTPAKVTMFNYFTRLTPKAVNQQKIEEASLRKSAPAFNKQHVDKFRERQSKFDQELAETESTSNYLNDIRSGTMKPFRVNRKFRGPLRARLLQFSEDVRPPYFGTWQKKSKFVGGRRPYGQDTEVFDYEVDSEAEWDIGGPGESLKGDDSEDDDEPADDYEIDMKTFVPHGYVSDDEVEANSDCDESAANRSADDQNCDIENNSNSLQIVGEVKAKNNDDPNAAPTKKTPKMNLQPITLGLYFEGDTTISDSKLEFLKAFEGVSCM